MTGFIKKSAVSPAVYYLILIIMLLCLPLVTAQLTWDLTIPSSGKTGIETVRSLHVEGKYIKDDLGRIVYLRGIAQGGFNEVEVNGYWTPAGYTWQYGYNVWDPDAVKANLDGMSEWGTNAIRLCSTIKGFKDPSIASTTKQHLRDVITWAGDRGIYIIFAPWGVTYNRMAGGENEPLPFPPYPNPQFEADEMSVISNEQDFVDWWVDMSNALKDLPNVIYELYNEPVGNQTKWFDVVQETVDAIRANADEHIILVHYGYCGGFDWLRSYQLNGTNIVYSNHIYRYPPGATIPLTQWTYDEIKNTFNTHTYL